MIMFFAFGFEMIYPITELIFFYIIIKFLHEHKVFPLLIWILVCWFLYFNKFHLKDLKFADISSDLEYFDSS